MKNTNELQIQDEAKIYGVPKRSNLYARLSKYAPQAIKRVVRLLESNNESVALGAAKVLLDKCLPDVKAITLENTNTGELKITITEDKPNQEQN